MSLADFGRFDGHHDDRPAAADAPGALFACADHGTIYKSDGTTWAPWADVEDLNAQATMAGNAAAIRNKAGAALDANRAFLASATPTNAQVVAQVKALTRQNNSLIRLALRRFDGSD